MAEVAYLLGAGASAEAVPVVLAMGEEIEKAIKKLNSSINHFANETFSFDGRNISYREAHQLAISRLGPLQYECKRHSSVDTYAKKLYFKDKVKFNELKATFSFYLTLAQVYNEIPDKRYDNFWASVLQDNGDLPEKVKIILGIMIFKSKCLIRVCLIGILLAMQKNI